MNDIIVLNSNFSKSKEYLQAKKYKSINFGYFDSKEKAIEFINKSRNQFKSKDGFGIAKLEDEHYYAFCGVNI